MSAPLENEVPPQEVLKFVIQNMEHIDIQQLARDVARASWTTRYAEETATAFVTKYIRESPSFVLERAKMRVFASQHAPKIIEEMLGGNKVPAIKLIRQGYGIALKEAKDLADTLQDELFMRKKVPTPYNCNATFDDHQKEAFNEIMEHIDG